MQALPEIVTYHEELARFFEQTQPELWSWFASDQITQQAVKSQKLALLRQTYRLDREGYLDLFETAERIVSSLGLEAGVHLYQAETGGTRNAGLYYMPGEIHIVFSGDVLAPLDASEKAALLGHEIAHFLFFECENGRYFVLERLLNWCLGEAGVEPSYVEATRRFRMWLEIYADRHGLFACGDRDAAIRMLVKTTTGLNSVSAQSYVDQAREMLLQSDGLISQQVTHPETYIRAMALSGWAEDAGETEAQIAELISGKSELERLDLLEQAQFTQSTIELLSLYLENTELASEDVHAHVRAILPDFTPSSVDKPALIAKVSDWTSSMKDYASFLLLDLASADPDLQDAGLRYAHALSVEMKLDNFAATATRELKLSKKHTASLGLAAGAA